LVLIASPVFSAASRRRHSSSIAAVAVAWNGGTVVSGRSLRLVEDRETNMELIAGLAWIVSLVALAAAALAAARLWPTATSQPA